MRLPEPRGPLGEALSRDLESRTLSAATVEHGARVSADEADAFTDEDLQLSLAVCYELHYRGFDGVSEDWEWDPALLGLRAGLERRHLTALRDLTGPIAPTDESVDRQLAALIAADDGPSLSSFMAKEGTLEQWREYLTLRSVYHLKEGDPHTFAIPRLSGRAKSAMVEIQADEYGGGTPARMHSELFAGLMRNLDLDATYGALWDDAPAAAFASVNTMSFFGLHRRWRGAALGPPGRRRDDLLGAEPPLLVGAAPARVRRARDGLLRRARRGRRRSRADRRRSTCAARSSPRSRTCCPTSCSGRPAHWPWTASPPGCCWAPGRPAAPPSAANTRRPDLTRRPA